MKFLKRLFGKKSARKENEQLVLVFIPALITMLKAAEDKKGSSLEEEEVLSLRDNAVCMTLRASAALEMDEKRGYSDIAPETVWEDWQILRHQM